MYSRGEAEKKKLVQQRQSLLVRCSVLGDRGAESQDRRSKQSINQSINHLLYPRAVSSRRKRSTSRQLLLAC